MSKEEIIMTQINSMYTNYLLLAHEGDKNSTQDVLNLLIVRHKNVIELIRHISEYLEIQNNKYFLQYFEDEKALLEGVINTLLFKLSTYIENTIVLENAQKSILDSIKKLKVIKCDSSVESLLIALRGIPKERVKDNRRFIRQCYLKDTNIACYINGLVPPIKPFDVITLSSLYYYLTNAFFFFDPEIAKDIIGAIITDCKDKSPQYATIVLSAAQSASTTNIFKAQNQIYSNKEPQSGINR
ncbi:MAG: hypothetical protein PHD02_00550 [Bacilli bacterium]|nr:hypothetical protein [Bacilli bacterium]